MEKFDLIDPEGTDEDIKIEPQLEICDANIVWYSLLFGFKGLLLIFGLFLAYETRSVKLKQINDSKLINMSIYNVVVLCMITGPVSLVITNQVSWQCINLKEDKINSDLSLITSGQRPFRIHHLHHYLLLLPHHDTRVCAQNCGAGATTRRSDGVRLEHERHLP